MQLMAVMRTTTAERAAFESVFTVAVEHIRAVQGSEPVALERTAEHDA